MANNSNRKFNWARKKIKVHKRRNGKKAQIRTNKLVKANGRKIDKTLEIKNDATEIIPISKIKAEDEIIKEWSRKGVLCVGDVIKLINCTNVRATIIGISDKQISYRIDGKKEEEYFHLDGFKKMIEKFNLTIFPTPAIRVSV